MVIWQQHLQRICVFAFLIENVFPEGLCQSVARKELCYPPSEKDIVSLVLWWMRTIMLMCIYMCVFFVVFWNEIPRTKTHLVSIRRFHGLGWAQVIDAGQKGCQELNSSSECLESYHGSLCSIERSKSFSFLVCLIPNTIMFQKMFLRNGSHLLSK